MVDWCMSFTHAVSKMVGLVKVLHLMQVLVYVLSVFGRVILVNSIENVDSLASQGIYTHFCLHWQFYAVCIYILQSCEYIVNSMHFSNDEGYGYWMLICGLIDHGAQAHLYLHPYSYLHVCLIFLHAFQIAPHSHMTIQ